MNPSMTRKSLLRRGAAERRCCRQPACSPHAVEAATAATEGS